MTIVLRVIAVAATLVAATAPLSGQPAAPVSPLQLLDVPYADYIVKPFRLDELGARIDAAR